MLLVFLPGHFSNHPIDSAAMLHFLDCEKATVILDRDETMKEMKRARGSAGEYALQLTTQRPP